MRRPGERGFALLLVFALAASIAIMLYSELPRVVFEAQRAKEDLLVQRGEQYQRAIQLYVRKTSRFPARLEDLEGAGGIRFLRQRYKDPMSGKDDWRLIHVGPGGVFLDSLVHLPPDPAKDKKKAESANTFITEGPAVGSTAPTTPAAAAAVARRASDRTPYGAGGQFPGAAPSDNPGETPEGAALQPPDPNLYPQPALVAGQPDPSGRQPSTEGLTNPPGQLTQQPVYPPGFQPGGVPRTPVATSPMSAYGPQGIPGLPGPDGRTPFALPQYPNAPASSQTGGQVPVAYPTQALSGGRTAAAPGQNPALDLIRNLLTQPRAGGLPGATGAGGQTIGGGIAGVASKYEAEGIKVYNERSAINEWEFVYDLKNDKSLAGGVGMAGVVPQQQQQSQPLSPFGQQPQQPSPQGVQPNPFGFPTGAQPPPPVRPGGAGRGR